jgi:hypothetical protein
MDEFDTAVNRIARETDTDLFDMPNFQNWTIDEKNYIGIREQSYRIARNFKWKMEGGLL